MSFIKKENHILTIDNSITKELCKDIIDKFNSEINNNNINISTIGDNKEMLIDETFGKIQKYLIRELNENIFKYRSIFETVDYKLKLEPASTTTPIIIKKLRQLEDEIEIQQKLELNNIEIKKFLFIWFLNDCDGELVFWNDYKIRHKLGRFVLMPISWCFNYYENLNKMDTEYKICGIINT
jgi:hypothetical protein